MKFTMHWIPALAVTIATTIAPSITSAETASWHCDGSVKVDDDEIAARAPNNSVAKVLQAYRERWDAQYIRAQCEAFAQGQPANISCLNGRRDWDAIVGMVPKEIWSMPRSEVRPIYLALQAEDSGVRDAFAYCRDVGAIE